MPLPDISWSHGGEVTSFAQYKSRVSTFKFTPKEQKDFRSYECTASNLLGSTKQKITIVMLGKFHPRTVEPRFNKVAGDRPNLFVKSRVCFIETSK